MMEPTINYNWEDLEVGRFDLNHSENFFAKKHMKHEKLEDDIMDLRTRSEGKENDPNTHNQKTDASPQPRIIVNEEIKQSGAKEAANSVKRLKAPPNLLKQPWSHSKSPHVARNPLSQNGKPMTRANPPSVYKYMEIYEKKKQSMLQKVQEEDKKNRLFHSRPVPNFSAIHEYKLRKQQSAPLQITAPVTPMVLKKSKEADEKRRQKLEELKRRNQPPKFTSRDPKVLHEDPFKPKKLAHALEPQPFNLHVAKRLEERKQYDEQIKKSFEEKKKQEEEDQKRREEELIKELRKMATFKARPNPFK